MSPKPGLDVGVWRTELADDADRELLLSGSLCGSVAHLSNFCPLLANPELSNQQFSSGNGSHRQSDIQGRPRVSIGHNFNNFNSELTVNFCTHVYFTKLHMRVYFAQLNPSLETDQDNEPTYQITTHQSPPKRSAWTVPFLP